LAICNAREFCFTAFRIRKELMQARTIAKLGALSAVTKEPTEFSHNRVSKCADARNPPL